MSPCRVTRLTTAWSCHRCAALAGPADTSPPQCCVCPERPSRQPLHRSPCPHVPACSRVGGLGASRVPHYPIRGKCVPLQPHCAARNVVLAREKLSSTPLVFAALQQATLPIDPPLVRALTSALDASHSSVSTTLLCLGVVNALVMAELPLAVCSRVDVLAPARLPLVHVLLWSYDG